MLTNEPKPGKRVVTSKQLDTEIWFLSADIDPEDDPDPPPPRRKFRNPAKVRKNLAGKSVK